MAHHVPHSVQEKLFHENYLNGARLGIEMSDEDITEEILEPSNHIAISQNRQAKNIADIGKELMRNVIMWNAGFRSPERTKGTPEWKQALKNNFIYITQLVAPDPYKEKKKWAKHLERARDLTIEEICPRWQTEAQQCTKCRKICGIVNNAIEKKKNPRAAWLTEQAYRWLQSLEIQKAHSRQLFIQIETHTFPPKQAIQIAHHVFLRGSGKLDSFVKHLKKKNCPMISQLINAHHGTVGILISCLLSQLLLTGTISTLPCLPVQYAYQYTYVVCILRRYPGYVFQ